MVEWAGSRLSSGGTGMTDILATLVLVGFALSAVLFIRPDQRRFTSSTEGFVFAIGGGLLFVVLCADRIALTSANPEPWRSVLDMLPGEQVTDFRSPAWIVWAVAVGYAVRALVFSRLQERFHFLTKANGTLASFVTLTLVAVRLLVQAYELPLAIHLLVLAIFLVLYLLHAFQFIEELAVRLPALAVKWFPEVLKDLGAYLGVPFVELAKLRNRFRAWADDFGDNLERSLSKDRQREPSRVDKRLRKDEQTLQADEVKHSRRRR